MPTKRDLFIFYFLSFTWGITMTIVGLFTLLFTVLFFKDQVEIKVVAGRICIRLKYKYFGGISLGIVYVVCNQNSYRLHTHELGHTMQNIMFGPLFLPVIGIPSFIRAMLWKRISLKYYRKYGKQPDYDSIWFEGQATRLGVKYFNESVRQLLRGQTNVQR